MLENETTTYTPVLVSHLRLEIIYLDGKKDGEMFVFQPAHSFNAMHSYLCSIHFETGHDRVVFALEILIDSQCLTTGTTTFDFIASFNA
jgi:hypothetical protein